MHPLTSYCVHFQRLIAASIPSPDNLVARDIASVSGLIRYLVYPKWVPRIYALKSRFIVSCIQAHPIRVITRLPQSAKIVKIGSRPIVIPVTLRSIKIRQRVCRDSVRRDSCAIPIVKVRSLILPRELCSSCETVLFNGNVIRSCCCYLHNQIGVIENRETRTDNIAGIYRIFDNKHKLLM